MLSSTKVGGIVSDRCAAIGKTAILAAGAVALLLAQSPATAQRPTSADAPPNVLMILLDDIGIDQWRAFGFGGVSAPRTPSLDGIARSGVRFRETWAMPTCSASRAAIFTGRLPQNNGVVAAILPATDLAVSQVSPYEMTLPKVLATAGYRSAMFGKYHLGSGTNNPAGNAAPLELGWDRFFGVLVDIDVTDTTAGGVGAAQDYPYGLVDDAAYGACFDLETGSCEDLGTPDGLKGTAVGRLCVTRGDVLVPATTCKDSPVSSVDLGRDDTGNIVNNGYYVWPFADLDIIRDFAFTGEESIAERAAVFRAALPIDSEEIPRFRGYTETAFVDEAIGWIKERNAENQPWFAVYSSTTVHTPYQPPPPELAPDWDVTCPNNDCSDPSYLPGNRTTANAMIQAMDKEVGRLLTETGIARPTRTGELRLVPENGNTLVVVIADNGTYASIVKAPFDPTRAKGTVYQTGVWVPLTVAGPMVARSKRGSIDHDSQINAVDVYSLIAQAAGIDYASLLPAGADLDARPILGLVTQSRRRQAQIPDGAELDAKGPAGRGILNDAAIKHWVSPFQPSGPRLNYAESGVAAKDAEAAAGLNACYVQSASLCTDQFFYFQGLCEANNGIWYGPPDNPDMPTGHPIYPTCCSFRNAVAAAEAPDGTPGFELPDGSLIGPEDVNILEDYARAIRNRDYKLVALDKPDCRLDDGSTYRAWEFYAVDNRPVAPRLDRSRLNLLSTPDGADGCDDPALSARQRNACRALYTSMQRVIAGRDVLPGDGNLDGVVDQRDSADAADYIAHFDTHQSTVFDFVGAPDCDPLTAICADGKTDEADLEFIRQRYGASRAD